ncbi:MAG TPA: enolase C-terminal domain-like protein [Gemmataceae bacterium]|nr:enolase C-terminal domain-like protein [Gemmataceae bacterium]
MSILSISAEPIFGHIRPDIAIVSSLGAHIVGQYVLVRIGDDEGRVGLGEASVTSVWSGETQAGTIALVRDVLAPLVIGADPFDTEWIERRLERAAFGNSFARAAVEMALLDLQGRILAVPVYKLLGGRDGSTPGGERGIRLKFVVGAVESSLAAERARRMVERGWRAIKVKVGRHDHPRVDVERLRAVREAIGPDVFLSVDANGGYTVEQAIWAARRFESLDVALFEQPTRRGDHAAMAEVRRRSGLPIMADESVFTLRDALEVIRAGAADVLSLYPGKHGGMRPMQAIARLAEAASIPCTIGSNLEREVATAAMAHVTLATPNVQCERFPGDLIGPVYFEQSLSRQALRYEADRVFVPEGSGLGVSVNPPMSELELPAEKPSEAEA